MKPLIKSGQEWTFDKIDEVYHHLERIAKEKYKLKYYPNQLEIISSEQMLDAYSAIGMPLFYSHWSFGERFIKESEAYRRGYMGLAYEIVINSNPCIAYLMEENTMLMQTLVIAHASFGHNTFFKNNYLFKQWTDASAILDYLDFAKKYIAECEEKYGISEVESVLDAAHALQHYGVDKYKRPPKLSAEQERRLQVERDKYIQSQLNVLWRTIPQSQKPNQGVLVDRFPKEPQENILYFLEKNAPRLEPWKRELLRIIRKIAQYFYPQMQTKIMNEGCLVKGSLIDTPTGLKRIEDIVNSQYTGLVIADEYNNVSSVSNWYIHENKPCVKIETHHGYIIHGGEDHKILIENYWVKLKDLKIGEKLPIIRGDVSLWKGEYQSIPFVDNVSNQNDLPFMSSSILDEKFAYWLGLLIGDNRSFYNKRVIEILNILGVYLEDPFYKKDVPELILQSPVSVVAAFIRGHADVSWKSNDDKLIKLISGSKQLLNTEQQLLLKMGVISKIVKQHDDYCLYIEKNNVKIFTDIIKHNLTKTSHEKDQTEEFSDTTVIIKITHDEGTTYDFTVDNTHQYKHSCVMNHNCATYFHYKLIHDLYDEKLIDEGAMLEFYQLHCGVVYQPEYDHKYYSGINPYALGFAMFKDIERIATSPTKEDIDWFGKQDWIGSGDYISAIKFAIEGFKDESFIQQFLSPTVIRDFKLFAIHDDEKDSKYTISAIHNKQGYAGVRDVLSRQNNIGYSIPDIQVYEVDLWGDRSLTLKHIMINDRPLNLESATKTVEYLSKLWGFDIKLISVDSNNKIRMMLYFKNNTPIIDFFSDK